jgi:uncharacterized protein YjbI with pentapeptide repeats
VGLLDLFAKPKPAPPGVIIRNRVGEQIDHVSGVWHLANADLRGRNWAHADLSGLCLDGANCEGINLFGSRLVKTSFCRTNLRGAEISFADVTGADFRQADLTDALMYQTETQLAKFDQAIFSEHSDIPGRKVLGTMRVIG